MKNNFKIGDKAIIKNNLKDINNFKGGYTSSMDKYIGDIVTIKDFWSTENAVWVEENDIVWDLRALEKIVFEDKYDLKEGDIVVLRNGDELIFDGDNQFTDLSENPSNGLCDLYELNDDLTFHSDDKEDRKNDIVVVKRPVKYTTIFNRKNVVKEMTIKEISDILGYDIKVIKEEN